jgi:hypothetical protein
VCGCRGCAAAGGVRLQGVCGCRGCAAAGGVRHVGVCAMWGCAAAGGVRHGMQLPQAAGMHETAGVYGRGILCCAPCPSLAQRCKQRSAAASRMQVHMSKIMRIPHAPLPFSPCGCSTSSSVPRRDRSYCSLCCRWSRCSITCVRTSGSSGTCEVQQGQQEQGQQEQQGRGAAGGVAGSGAGARVFKAGCCYLSALLRKRLYE